MENLTQRWTKSGYFFPKSMYFFYFHKRAVEITSSPLVARLRAWLNIHQYPWISLNILENAWMSVFYVRVLNMPDYFTCLTVFWMWHGCICKGYTDLRNMSKLNMPQYTLMSLSMPEHGEILLNDPKYTGKYLNKLFLTLPGFSICLVILDI